MKTIETRISARHIRLIEIFFEANELKNVKVATCEYVKGWTGYNVIEIQYDELDEYIVSKLTFMALLHENIPEMLKDYLLTCGVDLWDIRGSY